MKRLDALACLNPTWWQCRTSPAGTVVDARTGGYDSVGLDPFQGGGGLKEG